MSVFSLSRLGFGLVLCVGLFSCSGSPELQSNSGNVLSVADTGPTTKIREVQKNKANKVVRVQGKMNAQAPLMGGQVAYELRDDTGSIWVVTQGVTQGRLPAIGTQIGVQGQVRFKPISIAGQDHSSVYLEQKGAVEIVPANRNSDSKSS
jgi:hypothetical protein